MTDFLQFVSNKAKVYQPIAELLTEKLKVSKQNILLDLASGGGGGLIWLNHYIKQELPLLQITLTDYYPNIDAFKRTKKMADNFQFVDESVDARDVPQNLKVFRTQFLSFHHFKPKDAKQILQNAVDQESPIAIFEAQERSASSYFGMLISPIVLLLVTPFIKPLKFDRFFFTYFIPILPFCVLWDGLISCLRTYSVKEMKELVNTVKQSSEFNWDIGKKVEKSAKVLYLIGLPKHYTN
ncbi:MAG: class I SAM-dependent methyltransferase [Bacteroidota bacterium]